MPPDIDEVEVALRGIAPFLRRHVEPHLNIAEATLRAVAAGGQAGAVLAGGVGLPNLDDDPIAYTILALTVGVTVEPGSLAEALRDTGRVLLATRRYCARVNPQAFHRRVLKANGGESRDAEARERMRRRFEQNQPLLDDTAEGEFVRLLEQLDRVSFNAQQAIVDKLGRVNRAPVMIEASELRRRELMLRWMRPTIDGLVGAARVEFGAHQGIAFPSTRRAWGGFVSDASARIHQRGLPYAQVAEIFPGVGGPDPANARERVRQRTRRVRRRSTLP